MPALSSVAWEIVSLASETSAICATAVVTAVTVSVTLATSAATG